MPFARTQRALYCYTTSNTGQAINIAPFIQDLSFTTQAPGGYFDLTVKLWLPPFPARVLPPEFGLFSNVALMDGPDPIWLGRIEEPAIMLDTSSGTYLQLTAMGAANIFKDDPQDSSYVNKTVQQIALDQLSGATLGRGPWLPIDSDYSQIFAANPATQWNYNPQSKTMEDIFNEICALTGDYMWLVWGHPTHRDAAGFPTWQLWMAPRDATTVSYSAGAEDLESFQVKPAAEYSYNAIEFRYKDAVTAMPAALVIQDSRLNANRTQGTAPFPYRRLVKDDSGYLVSGTQALAVANTLLAQYQNGAEKIQIGLVGVRDANTAPMPLFRVRAGTNIQINSLAQLGQTLPFGQVHNTNTFYITQTRYEERQGQAPVLTITCDTFLDRAAWQIARIEVADRAHRRVKHRTHGHHQAVGESEHGTCSALSWGSGAVTTDTFISGTNFKTTMVNTPTGISLTTTTSLNCVTPTPVNIQQTGFMLQVNPTANGKGYWHGTYITQGN